MVDPVTFKVFTDNTHIVAIRHGSEANVFAWETVERLNIKPKMWLDLVDDREFGRSDIITLQDPQNIESRDLSQFKFLKDGESVLSKEQEEERKRGSVNIDALGRVGDKVLRAKEAVEKARRERSWRRYQSIEDPYEDWTNGAAKAVDGAREEDGLQCCSIHERKGSCEFHVHRSDARDQRRASTA